MRIVLGILQLKSWIFLKLVTLMAELVVQGYGGIIGSSTFSVMAGGRIELPCDINTTSSEGDLSLILWHKDQSRVPIYSIDVRNTSLPYARHFPSINISTKSYFNVSDNPAVLSLERLEKTDEGLYRCRVEYKRSRTETSESMLKVMVPPKEAIIMDEYGQHLHGMIGPYNEGFPLALACEGEGGDPSPAVRWWRDAELLDDSYYITPQGFARNELLLSSLRRTDLLTKLTCQVSNSNLTEPVTSSVIIDMNLKPTDVRITSMYRPISVDRFTEIVCVASGARPPAQISWWLDGEKLTSRITESTVRDENLTVSSLLFGPTKHDNQRNLSCRGDNPQVPDSVLEDTWILDIHFPPQLSVKVDKESAIQEGDSINLTCVAQANPPIVELEWLKDSQSLGPTSKKDTRSRTLHISNVTSEHKGRYQCEATNSEGKSVSEPALLKVQYVPRCVSVRSSIYGVGQTESVSVACEVDASPSTVSFTWALDGAKILSTEQYSSNGSHSVATISPRSPKDYGLLMCWASNAVGRQREPCTFRIIPAGPPEEPRNCLITNRTTHCLVLECEMGHDGGLTQLFQLEIFGTDSDKFLANVTAHSAPKFTVCSLPSRESLVLIVYSLNNKGRSKQITMHVSSTESNETEEDYSGALEALIGVLIGALAVLILLAVTVTILVCVQRKRRDKKGRAYPDEEKSDPQLSKECKEPCVASSYGPDIIPEKSFYRERSSSLINVIEVEQGINPSSAQSDPSSRKYREYDAFSYPEGHGLHATPTKLSVLQKEEEIKETDLQSIVETPLISSIHPTLHQWPNSKKEATIRMSTPV